MLYFWSVVIQTTLVRGWTNREYRRVLSVQLLNCNTLNTRSPALYNRLIKLSKHRAARIRFKGWQARDITSSSMMQMNPTICLSRSFLCRLIQIIKHPHCYARAYCRGVSHFNVWLSRWAAWNCHIPESSSDHEESLYEWHYGVVLLSFIVWLYFKTLDGFSILVTEVCRYYASCL